MAKKIAETLVLTDKDAKDFIKKIKANDKALAKAKKGLEKSSIVISPVTTKKSSKKTRNKTEDARETMRGCSPDEAKVRSALQPAKKEKNKNDYSVVFKDHAVNTSKLNFPDLNFMYDGIKPKQQQIFPPVDESVFLQNTSTTNSTNPTTKNTISWEEFKEKINKQHELDNKFPRNIYVYLRTKYYRVVHFIQDLPYDIKYFIQRGKRGYSIRDTWSFDMYLADVIGSGLLHLAKNTHGWPDSKFKTFEEWQKELETIGNAFITYNKLDDMWYEEIKDVETDKERKKILDTHIKRCKANKEIMKRFIDHFENLWD